MSDLFKKALGVFVNFEEAKKPEAGEAEAAPAGPAEPVAADLPDLPADLSQDPDVARVRDAIKLLADLPLADIPVEKARELVARTLKFAGLDAADLAEAFQRALGLQQALVAAEQQKLGERQQLNQQRLQTLEQAIAQEKADCEAELTERNRRISQATAEVSEIAKAMAFFVTETPET